MSSFEEDGNVKAHASDSITPAASAGGSFILLLKSKSLGVRKVELYAKQYQHPVLRVILFVCIFVASYAYGLDFSTRNTFQTYATNSYQQHSLLAAVNVIKAVVATASQPAYARLADRFGRLEILFLAIVFYIVGTVIESQAYDIQRFAAGSFFFQLGYSGAVLVLQIIVADFSNLNWRVFAMFVPVFSFVINTWISGNVASSLLVNHSWNYCIGIWAFIFPLACIPLVLCFLHMRYKITNGSNEDKEAWRLLHLEEKEHLRWASWKENIVVDVFWEVDLVGMLMVICLFGFLLVPMTLAGGVHDRWTKASTLVPLVIGFLFIPVFIVWEWKFAKYPMTPFPLLKDRGVWAALCVGSSIYFIWTMPNDYLYTVLVVGMNQTVKSATRISSLYTFTLVITGTIFGLFVIYIKRIKGFIIFGVLLWFVSMGLLIHYRGSSSSGVEYKEYVRGVIGALCLMGFGGGFFTYATQVSITACTNHEYMGVIISIFSALYHLGSALGACVSGAVWTNLLFKTLQNKFEDAGLSSEVATAAYKSPLTFIRTYRWGSPERIQVVLAYSEVQRILCIIGIALCVPLFVVVFFLRDNKLESVQSLELNDKSSISEENIGETVVFSEKEGDYLARKIRLVWRS